MDGWMDRWMDGWMDRWIDDMCNCDDIVVEQEYSMNKEQ